MLKADWWEGGTTVRLTVGIATLVTHKQSGKTYIAKRILLNSMSKRDQEDTDKEAKILRRLNHPHVVKFIESFLENDALVIIMEYCAGGDLKDFLQSYKDQKRPIPNAMICTIFAQLASAVAYIHSQKIMHRDINIEFRKQYNIDNKYKFINSDDIISEKEER